uniref:TROVE domain-containing protein n=1 Tax=Naja naja TaxID=35670 RepID=A0A8C6XEC4_NAJNA
WVLNPAAGFLANKSNVLTTEPSQSPFLQGRVGKYSKCQDRKAFILRFFIFLTILGEVFAHLYHFCLFAQVALYARQELNIRSTANFLLALASYLQPCRSHVRRYFCHAVQLPSDWMQVAKLYQSLAGEEGTLAPMPSCLRAGMADKFRQFDAYQLAKYNTRKSRGKQRHKPKAGNSTKIYSSRSFPKHQEMMDSVKEEAVRDLFSLKNLIHRLHISEPAQHVMSLLGRRYPTDLPSFSRSRLPGPWDPALAGTRMQLPVPQTWDRELSYRGNKAAVWEELIGRKLPFMAMLRNLRNILRSGVSERHHQHLLKRLEDKDSVIRSRQLPFRFLSAYKVILDLEKKFKEKALCDVSILSVALPRHCKVSISTSRDLDSIPLFIETFFFLIFVFHRVVHYTAELLQRYCQALETAVGLSVKHNMHPIPGRTLILISNCYQLGKSCVQGKNMYCPTFDRNSCNDQKNPMTVGKQLSTFLTSARFMSECGNSRFLEHVDKVDEIHGLPKQQRTATAQWRSVRIFISSTFRDMHGERDLLIRSVFPELRARAARFCLAIQEIDLRWGITEQESQRNKQVELCLSEVSRSDLFIGILGERYGHVPKETSLPEEPQYEWVKTYPSGRSITELEAVQFLNGSHDPTAESRAFFYLREPDFLGYFCQWGGVAQGRPFVKGLEDFGHRVMKDVWKCLQHHFIKVPEIYQSSSSCAISVIRRHALQESFQESQQRRFCARMKLLNTTVAQMRGGKLYVVSGEPGQGKTVFLVSKGKVEAVRRSGELGIRYGDMEAQYRAIALRFIYHFTKEKGDIYFLAYRGLVTQFECLLHAVAKLLKRRQSLVLLIDGADLIHTAGGELVSDWLPENVPQQVSLVLSISEESTLLKSLKQRKDTTFIPLQPLSPPDRAVIVRKDLAQHGKKLEESAFNNQMQLVLLKRGSRQPLYLSLLIQDLRLFALYEKVRDSLRTKLPISLPLMMQHLLGCLEQDHGLELVTITLVSLWASRDDLYTTSQCFTALSKWLTESAYCPQLFGSSFYQLWKAGRLNQP